ncbi:MAG TPA: NarK family nitrate/nitrite MFS transporter [Burkholderiaceae bacterium]|nr:NarK family nitrate/nitrite MFS transporter [Burkholderiaceae bacterium]
MSKYLFARWESEADNFWKKKGKATANRNRWISILALLLAFAIWMVWSVVVVNLPNVGFKYSINQLFWLTAVPGLSGATLRIFYSFMVPIFGGRKWTTISTASLLIPALGIGFAVQDTDTSYPTMMMLALLCGFGGGNFASSMANISSFFPKSQKGYALGMNAGLGNLGVPVVQFVVPLVITTSVFGALGGDPQTVVKAGQTTQIWLQNAGFIWVPFIVVATIAAWFGMNDIASANASFADQAVIFKRKHNWLMCWLCVGTFGSFIGYSAAFPLLTKTLFPEINPLQYAFLGPLVGALARVGSGWVSDKLGGAAVILWTFVAMIVAVLGVMLFLPHGDSAGHFLGFFWMFMLLFTCTGIGNAATFRMIPAIFLTEHRRAAAGKGAAAQAQAVVDANREAAAVLGFTSAIAAYGAFFIPKTYGTAIEITGGPEAALWLFIGFYASCIAITWWFYARKNANMPC